MSTIQPTQIADRPLTLRPNEELGFGELPAQRPKDLTTKDKAHAIGILILIGTCVLVATAIVGFVIAAPVAIGVGSAVILAIGSASGAGLGVIVVAVAGILANIKRYRELKKANAAVPESELKLHNTPSLGRFNDNNSVLVTQHAKESQEWKLDLIRNAKQSIEISGNFCGGKIFRQALDEMRQTMLREAALKVHLLSSFDLLEDEDKKKIAQLQKEFPGRFFFLETDTKIAATPSLRSHENHVKLMVVDEKYFVVGGTGLQQGYTDTGDVTPPPDPTASAKQKMICNGVRDMDVIGLGATAKTLRQEFFKLWAVWESQMGTSVTGSGHYSVDHTQPTAQSLRWEQADKANRVSHRVRVKATICDPHKRNAISREYVRVINAARKVVRVANLAFNPPKGLGQALQIASRRAGMHLDVITNGRLPTSPALNWIYVQANYPHYLPLLLGRNITPEDTPASLKAEHAQNTQSNGLLSEHRRRVVRVHQFAVPTVQYHKKVLIGDDTVVIGSYNLSRKSHRNDYELVLTLQSQEVANRFNEVLDRDIELSQEMDFKEAQELHSSWMGRFQAYCLSNFLV